MARGKVLIVEDDVDWRSLLYGCLANTYDVMAVGEHDTAMELIQERSFDVIILDLRLRDRDENNRQGMELLALLREKEKSSDWSTRVVVVSAYRAKDLLRKGFKVHGLFDYIPKKQFDEEEYRDTVRRAMQGKGRRQQRQ